MHGYLEGDSETRLVAFEGRHFWTITNWRSWVNCSSEDATLYSAELEVSAGANNTTRWQVKAYPKTNTSNGHQYLAFQLVSLNEETPLGSFHFVTYTEDWMLGRRARLAFAPLPLDSAWHYSTCVRAHPAQDLVMCVKIKIVASTGVPSYRLLSAPPQAAMDQAVTAAPPNPYLEGRVMPLLDDDDEVTNREAAETTTALDPAV